MKKIRVNNKDLDYRVSVQSDKVIVSINSENYSFSFDQLNSIPLFRYGRKNHIWNKNEYFEVEELSLSSSENGTSGSLNSPMPGKVFKLLKKEGDNVKSGETIMILEAMKMEHPIKSPIDGVVSKVNFQEGEIVSGGIALATVDKV